MAAVLAKCINASFSESLLVLGEYYLIEDSSPMLIREHPLQDNVFAYHVPDSLLVEKNFKKIRNSTLFTVFFPLEEASAMLNIPAAFLGAKSRFEIVISETGFQAALHRAKERVSLTR